MREYGEKPVLVTGGAGFLGSHLCERLLTDGCGVICADSFFTGTRRTIAHLLYHPMYEVLRHDVTCPFCVEVDEIHDPACPASAVHYQFDPVQTTRTSVHGAINMLGPYGPRMHPNDGRVVSSFIVQVLKSEDTSVFGDGSQTRSF